MYNFSISISQYSCVITVVMYALQGITQRNVLTQHI